MKPFNLLLIAGLIAASTAPARAGAQQAASKEKESTRRNPIPADSRPPKGMCRIWIDGVPAAQQPAATDCPTAIKNRPTNGRVIFGDDPADSLKGKAPAKGKMPPNIKGFTDVKSPPVVIRRRPPDGL